MFKNPLPKNTSCSVGSRDRERPFFDQKIDIATQAIPNFKQDIKYQKINFQDPKIPTSRIPFLFEHEYVQGPPKKT